jgi:hypothetical protein
MEIRHILAPADFSEAATQAVPIACELAQTVGAKLSRLHVIEVPVSAIEVALPLADLERESTVSSCAAEAGSPRIRASVPASIQIDGEGWLMKLYWIGIVVLLIMGAWAGHGSAGDLAPFIHDLKTGDESTRIRAVMALGESGDPHAVDALREALQDDSRLVRQYALHALMDLLRILEHTSRLVTRWLHELRDRFAQPVEEPQTTAVKRSFGD